MAKWEVSGEESFGALEQTMQKVAQPGPIIDRALKESGADTIKQKIMPLIPRSGRSWRGKAAPAASAQPFTDVYAPLSVEIVARGKYGYLYFPNDGSNTVRHAGNQQFMERGLDQATSDVIEQCVGALLKEIGG